ncbi:Nicotinamide mononucleotide adenylyltransferase [Halanaeroarchaeum sp. HSR-CO]|uniref:nicotinamide-nucleotide adenylyltransferase n=1 Tax=Halanaeroarchaeum sp. HSR-CO TaxID=2866382 RepID=UPI00217D011F|nr:nicotinamide-nucleotide adenylyltransferase [Halanaeroarchaeum sp. HSR-CO]UWG47251.1 Nicotinamide mononucleotide adenylyltransferase [Halanaeroarchaeum sp. HSR-CO]
MTRGLYIGRFQPYHDGHQQVVEDIVTEVDELIIAIGSADRSHTQRDPFTAGERIMMITKSVADIDDDVVTYVVPIEDINRNSVWVSHLESMSPRFEVAYSNNPLVIQLFEESGTTVRQSPMFDRDVLKGSKIRKKMAADDGWRSLLPQPVVDTIEEIDGIERIQRVGDTDNVPLE